MSYDLGKLTREVNETLTNAGVNTVPVSLNGRLTQTLGRAHASINTRTNFRWATKIDFSKQLVSIATDSSIREVLLHECAHIIAYSRDPYVNHGHDNFFRNICAEIGCSADEPSYQIETKEGISCSHKYSVMCPNCGEIGRYNRKSKSLNNLAHCYCSRCKSHGLTLRTNF